MTLSWGWIAGVLALLAALGGAYLQGRSDGAAVTRDKYAKAEKALDDAVQKTAIAARLADAQIIAAERTRQVEVRSITREIPKIIVRDSYRGQCIDADGVHLVERAVGAANGGAAAPGGADGDPARIRTRAGDD